MVSLNRVGENYALSSNYYLLLILRSQDVCATQMMKGKWQAMALENYPTRTLRGIYG